MSLLPDETAPGAHDETAIDVSVLIPVLNEERHIREAVRHIQAQRFDGAIEFLFMDGGSDDRTREILEGLALSDPRIRVLDNPGRRTTNGLNVGLAHARGEYVARIDAHSFHAEDYLQRGVQRLRAGDDVVWAAGPAVPAPVGRWSARVAVALASPVGQGGSRKWREDGTGVQEWDLDTGVYAGVWRRETLLALGGWDQGWPVNQDSELAARVHESGGRIVCLAPMAARYVPRDSPKALFKQYWRYGYYRARTARRHPDSMRIGHLVAAGAGAAVAGALVPGRHGRPARAMTGVYLLALLAASAREAPRHGVRLAAGLPVVFAAIHVGGGLGFIAGCLRFGPPLQALARLGRR